MGPKPERIQVARPRTTYDDHGWSTAGCGNEPRDISWRRSSCTPDRCAAITSCDAASVASGDAARVGPRNASRVASRDTSGVCASDARRVRSARFPTITTHAVPESAPA